MNKMESKDVSHLLFCSVVRQQMQAFYLAA